MSLAKEQWDPNPCPSVLRQAVYHLAPALPVSPILSDARCDTLGGAILGHRSIICIKHCRGLLGDVAYQKYQGYLLCDFRQEDLFIFPHISL